MSPLWRERVTLGFYPDRLVLARARGEETVAVPPCEAPAERWRAALEALAGVESLRRAEVTVVLSSFFVRYTIVQLAAAIAAAPERLALARHCLARVHGAAADWTVRLSGEVACAVDPLLVQALRDALAARANRLRALQPRLMASFNGCRRKLDGRASWFVDVEPGLATLALVVKESWQSLRTVRVRARWQDELAALIARESCLVDSPADCPRLVHASP